MTSYMIPTKIISQGMDMLFLYLHSVLFDCQDIGIWFQRKFTSRQFIPLHHSTYENYVYV